MMNQKKIDSLTEMRRITVVQLVATVIKKGTIHSYSNEEKLYVMGSKTLYCLKHALYLFRILFCLVIYHLRLSASLNERKWAFCFHSQIHEIHILCVFVRFCRALNYRWNEIPFEMIFDSINEYMLDKSNCITSWFMHCIYLFSVGLLHLFWCEKPLSMIYLFAMTTRWTLSGMDVIGQL